MCIQQFEQLTDLLPHCSSSWKENHNSTQRRRARLFGHMEPIRYDWILSASIQNRPMPAICSVIYDKYDSHE